MNALVLHLQLKQNKLVTQKYYYTFSTIHSNLIFAPLGPGEPNNKKNKEHCAIFGKNSKKWVDVDCTNSEGHQFLCEIPYVVSNLKLRCGFGFYDQAADYDNY